MTLLISQVEALKGNIEYPFIHDFNGSVAFGELAKLALDSTEVHYEENMRVENQEPHLLLTIKFMNEEEVASFLEFEQRMVVAQILREDYQTKPNRWFSRKAPEKIPARESIHRINRAYNEGTALVLGRQKKSLETINQ